MNKRMYVSQLDGMVQEAIKDKLYNALEEMYEDVQEIEEAIENAMDSKVSDLEELIDVDEVVNMQSLIEPMKFMQGMDNNGSWMDAIRDVSNGDATFNDVVSCAISTLKIWNEENGNREFELWIGKLENM